MAEYSGQEGIVEKMWSSGD